MPSVEARFEIRFHSSRDGASTTLHQSSDANTATVAFHAILEQLRADARDGAVLLVKYDPVRHVMLRHPLAPAQ